MTQAPLIKVTGVWKAFPGVQALRDVSVDFRAGECHALMGENGAGKSTLGKLLAGLYRPDQGEVRVDGRPVHFRGPAEAAALGIAIVHQELLFCENMTVAENLCLADLPHRGIWVDDAQMQERAKGYLALIGADLDPRQRLGELPIAKQQLVQIAGAVGRGARAILFDEPTSSLSQGEAERLLALIQDLKARGVLCIYVSHRMDEVLRIADRVTVLRDGDLVATRDASDLSQAELVRLMIGRDLAASQFEPGTSGEEILQVRGLSSAGRFQDVSLALRRGEILGLAGLVGAGRTEVAEAAFGLDPYVSGEVRFRGEPIRDLRPSEMLRRGVGLVPEDRKRHGLVLSLSARENISLPILDRLARGGWVSRSREDGVVGKFFDRMRVKAPSPESLAAGLSGGNQQKLVLAKWLAADCEALLVDEPTRGVDVGAKAEIHALLKELAAEGKAVLLISSELPELLALSDRILVMREGRIVAELPGRSTEEAVMKEMAGVK